MAFGRALCWGQNDLGQLGSIGLSNFETDLPTNSLAPVQVDGLTADVTAITAGGAHSCAVVSGKAMCWGYNSRGQLGNNSETNAFVPVQVTGLTEGVTAIAAGGNQCSPGTTQCYGHTCAIINGGARCWGPNSSGQLSNNSKIDSKVPVQVEGLTAYVTAIAGGTAHSCAIVNGEAYCWGENGYGQLGGNSPTSSLVPVRVKGLTGLVTSITVYGNHSCAVVDGAAYCWGIDDSYPSDDIPGTIQSPEPVQVQGLSTGVTLVTTGANHTCALVNGGVECWGTSLQGQLGRDAVQYSGFPIDVLFP